MPNYLIPEELAKGSHNHSIFSQSYPPKMIFLEQNDEKFFLNFPKKWEEPLRNNLGNIYEDGNTTYSFSVSTYDGQKISSYSLNMVGIEFKNYLAGLLKFAKTISLSITNGINESNYIICKA